jgi:signal peptidase II
MHLLGIITGTSLLLSVASAQFVDHFLIERVAVFGSFAGFQLSHNPGIAFGLRLPPVFQEILIGIALIIVGVIAVRATQKDRSGRKRSSATTRAAFGLILGGGIANIIDRIPDGLVTDFIQIGTFPTFNVADSCITIGAALLLWTSIRRPQESSNNAI